MRMNVSKPSANPSPGGMPSALGTGAPSNGSTSGQPVLQPAERVLGAPISWVVWPKAG